ncbi:MAG TPA: carboxylating nicotinate-nucleotide diphosphorylase [Fimbriimonadaceae bacterium]|nr:carboxylating nicotinate-nucleotide diphosphorylase [Fimbriimonadaceae bacterium]
MIGLFEEAVRAALREDLGRAGDITTAATIPPGTKASGDIVARKAGTIAGLPAVTETFRQVDPSCLCDVLVADGKAVAGGTVLARVSGEAASLLTAERTALNFLGHLSGVATATAELVSAVAGTKAAIVDTRKTTPGLRALEKYAVRMGGGKNHRFGLDDAVLIKDNHIVAAGGVGPAVRRAKEAVGHMVVVECEVENLVQLEEALAAGAGAILLDNMPPETLREAVRLTAGRAVLEASGGSTLATVRAVADTGVDLISAGWITHSAPNLDVALDFVSR